MFKKILIANRGEVALRIIFACRELGIKTVAVYSEADENSLHVRFADEDVCIGPARSADSYLNVPAVISAAEITGADAIHPGYGFLSESAYLAEVCEACHIKFIGPDPQVIRLMGDKARARRVMKKAGVPILPGSDGPIESEEKALKLAKEIGYPVIVKATAGGGGRGMRVVRAPAELSHAVKTAQREAEAAFGVGDVYIEKYVESPRHIEFQILGDQHGNVVHLGERECSIQRRHQKLIEESPSPALSEKMRRKMGGIVIDAAKAVQYTNAGTFEFLMDPDGRFYFMEANTRLQVEHPVTEMVTGIDIVKEQIRIAAGERLGVQAERRRRSPATRSSAASTPRIPETFVPSPGLIHVFSVPGGPGVRVETFAHSDCTISPYYDSMIAKIIVHGRDRQEAIARMQRTLEMTVDRRHQDDHPAAPADPADPEFVAGKLSTSFMERFLARPAQRRPPRRSGLIRRSASLAILIPPPLRHLSTPTSRARAGWTSVDLAAACLRRRRALSAAPRQDAAAATRSSTPRRAWSSSRAAYGAPVIVNDRADIARLAGADGVHVGQDDLSPAAVRARRRRRRDRRPLDAHAGAARRARCCEPVDLRRDRAGLRHGDEGDRLRRGRARRWSARRPRRASARGLPLVAIGGITLENAASVHRRPAPRRSRSSATCWPTAIRRRACGPIVERLSRSNRSRV